MAGLPTLSSAGILNRVKRFGDNLRDARVAAGFTQQQLAERVGAQQSNVSAWEQMDRPPSEDTILSLSTAIGCPPSQLLFEVRTKLDDIRDGKYDPPSQPKEDSPRSPAAVARGRGRSPRR